jgi:DNA-binding beta-propeller fold protein YncE
VIVRLDAASKLLTDTWPIGCESPSGLAIDIEHARLFAVCDGNKMSVVDTKSGKELALPAIGDGPDAAGFDAKRQLAFSSNGDGTLSVVDAKNGYKTVQTLPTQKGARTMSYDSATDRIYLSAAEYGPAPAPTATSAHPRPAIIPDSFTIVVVGRK